ncbi:hypothetical protein LguiA_034155 [Lonicera macranthoides]
MRLGCTVEGHLNESKFSHPMPWIGISVAAAAAACALAMAVDVFNSFRSRKFWFPCKFFSLNATTLSLIAMAVKLSVDLNTSMPFRQDQLAKLSSTVFICTAIANSMPSIGNMKNKEMFMNIVALGILVITSIFNICIQLGTGVVYVFQKEHAFVMFLMLILLAILCSSALSVPTTKLYLEHKYKSKFKIAVQECKDQTEKSVTKKLREGLIKYWIMAHTSSSQFVIGQSAPCTASGAFCLISTVTLVGAMVRSYLMPWSFKFCDGESDYKWSSNLILVTQTVAVVVGTVAPTLRWFTAIKSAINLGNMEKEKEPTKSEFKVEEYWTLKLVESKKRPISSMIGAWRGRKLAHNARNRVLDLCIGIQSGIVLLSKLVRLISAFNMSWLSICYYCCCRKLQWLYKRRTSVESNNSESESQPSSHLNLRRFVMHLEGEEHLVDRVIEDNRDALDHWLQMGEKQQPKYLLQFFEQFIPSENFDGVMEFDSNLVPPLHSEEPPNSWALPLVTLTSIVVSLPDADQNSIKQLTRTVHEGLIYARKVEKNLDIKKELVDIKKAAETVWLGVDLYHKWLDVDLHKMSDQGKTPREIIEEFSKISKNKLAEFKTTEMNGRSTEMASRWPINVLAANSMYRICQTILLDYKMEDNLCSKILLEKLTLLISDILGACLSNLGHVMTVKCLYSTTEEREGSIRSASLLLGKTERLLKILERRPPPSTDWDQLAYIDYWRLLSRQKGNLPLNSSLECSKTASFISSDLYLNIE